MSRESRDLYQDYELLQLRSGLREQLEKLHPFVLGKVMLAVLESFVLLRQLPLLGKQRAPELADVTFVSLICFEMDTNKLAKGVGIFISESGTEVQDHGVIGDPDNMKVSINVDYNWLPSKPARFEKDLGNDAIMRSFMEDIVKSAQKENPPSTEEVIPSVVLDVVQEEKVWSFRAVISKLLKRK